MEQTTLTGYYTDPSPSANIMIYFGCRRNMKQVCYRPMNGYFYYFKIWSNQGLTQAQLQSEITNSCGTTGCGVCDTDNTCFSARSVLIYQLDLEQNSQILTSTLPVSPAITFQLGANSGFDATTDPTRVPLQGLHFGKGLYIESLSTINIPQIFTVEAFVRFDVNTPGQNGDLQYIYEAQRNLNYFAIALDNTYLKVIINGFEGTYYSQWLQNTGWRYISVTVIKQFYDSSNSGQAILSSSLVKIFVDKTLAATFTIPSYF